MKANTINPKDKHLHIVGCGPGDPDLLTLKAHQVIRGAKAILYDQLVSKEILALASPTCLLVYVGKKPYQTATSQEEINALINYYACLTGNVVRLKGGDPFIFGRGHEEITFAKLHGISTSYIPGISSLQLAGLCGIPLTHRGCSDGFWALTGTTKDGTLSKDMNLAVQSNATVVIYMGMNKLTEISQLYVQAGKGNSQACIIENGSLPSQRKIGCRVDELEEAARKHSLGHPAIIIIGPVVALANLQQCPKKSEFSEAS